MGDLVEASIGPGALIITGEDKFFSNGLDVEFITSSSVDSYLAEYQKLLARLLVLNVPTITAINGHMFAGGCLFGFCTDFRVMRSGKGFICMPEIDLGFGLLHGMATLVRDRVPDPLTLRDLIFLGKRYTAEEAKAARLIDDVVDIEQLMPTCLQIANKVAPKAKSRQAYSQLKVDMLYHVVQ